MNDRHARVEVKCEWCGVEFLARKERVDKGQGRYCGKKCFDEWQRKQKKDTIWGRKDLATTYLVGGRYCARWYDENGKTKSTPYPRWWWEMNVGEIPKGLLVLHVDNNPLNIDPSNFKLGTKSEVLKVGNATRKSNPDTWANYRNIQSKRMVKKWENGDFDDLKGIGHYRWKGGTSKDIYPDEFYQNREFVKTRDNYHCQVCWKDVNKSRVGHVHHRDGNKQNSDLNNLILLCRSCHSKVHGSETSSPPIMALRSELA